MKFVQKLIPALIVIILGGMVQSVLADHGRSPLIDYVIKQEAVIEKIQKDIHDLKQQCQTTIVSYDYTQLACKTKIGMKDVESKEVLALQQRYQDLFYCIEITLHDIEVMFDTGAIFNVSDDFGKTALNYCNTKEIYYKLRACDMPFQYDAWIYIHSYECIYTSLVLGFLALALYQQ